MDNEILCARWTFAFDCLTDDSGEKANFRKAKEVEENLKDLVVVVQGENYDVAFPKAHRIFLDQWDNCDAKYDDHSQFNLLFTKLIRVEEI